MDSTQTQLSTSEQELHQRSTSTSTKLPYKYFLTAWVQNPETRQKYLFVARIKLSFRYKGYFDPTNMINWPWNAIVITSVCELDVQSRETGKFPLITFIYLNNK